MQPDHLYRLSEVAEITGLSERALHDGARANKIPHHYIARRRYMTASQVAAYLSTTLIDPTAVADK